MQSAEDCHRFEPCCTVVAAMLINFLQSSRSRPALLVRKDDSPSDTYPIHTCRSALASVHPIGVLLTDTFYFWTDLIFRFDDVQYS